MTFHFSDLTHGLVGHFLIASPFITTPPFAKAVIFICAHSTSEGTMGIIINRHLTKPTPDELLKQLGINSIPVTTQFSISSGGPIENAHGLVLHSADWEANGSVNVTDKVKLSASLDVLRDLSMGQGPQRALLALGHSNWACGQLEDEVQNNLWYVAPYDHEILFGKNYTKKWREALKLIAIDPKKLSFFIGQS